MKPWKHKIGANCSKTGAGESLCRYYGCKENEVYFGCRLGRRFRSCEVYKGAEGWLRERGEWDE